MKTLPEPMVRLAVILAALAGFVDVLAFLSLGGFFASFMSGNSTRLAIGIGGNGAEAMLAAGLILAFVGGVMGGTIVGERGGTRRLSAILALVAALIALCALVTSFTIAQNLGSAPLLLLAAAMGALNTLFSRDASSSVALTYMTGTLVRLGQGLAHAASGKGTTADWLPYLMAWGAFLGGGLIGVGLYWRIGLTALWLAVLTAGLLSWRLWPRSTGDQHSDGPLPKI